VLQALIRQPAAVLLALQALCWVATSPALADEPTPPDGSGDPGLYVVVEASQRPLDALLILPPVCQTKKADCAMVEQVLRNDARLSGFVRSLSGPASIAKTQLPNFAAKPGAIAAAGGTYALATLLRPAKEPGYVELLVDLTGADGKSYALGDYQQQMAPATTGLRSLAHVTMNAVQGALTGVYGTFDSVIYYSAPAQGCNRCIWMMDADGHNRRVLVSDPGIHMFPVQLQDGGLAYTSFRTGMPSLFKLDAAQVMALADYTPTVAKGAKIDRKKPAPITQRPPEDLKPFAAGPDLQFRGCAQSTRGDIVATINDGDQADLWLLDHNGEPVKNLTNNPADDLGPSFSPDGEWLAFVSDRSGGQPQVFVMRADGSDQKRLTWSGPYNTDPDWGPTGRLAYSGMRGTAIDVLTVTMDGRMQRLTPGQGRRSLEPTWSPDGRRVIYASNEDGKGLRLWMSSADGAVREPLDTPPGHYFTPSWQRLGGRKPRLWPNSGG